jgi:hypothetical protein
LFKEIDTNKGVPMGKLSAVQIKNIQPEKKLVKYSDGDGLGTISE